MSTLIIYDSNGTVWTSMTVEDAPAGLEKYVFEVPEGAMIEGVDVTNPQNPVPVYTSPKSYNVDQMSSDITDLQIALAEVYEMLAQGGN